MKRQKCPQQSLIAGTHTRRDFIKASASAGFGLGLLCMGISSFAYQSDEKNKQKSDEFRMMAYCCLKCDKCDAYTATKNNDDELRAKVAKRWKMEPEKINCEGCKSDKCLFNCSARVCAKEKKVITCAHCKDFPSCDKEIWKKQPKLREIAEEVRKKLDKEKK